jgi:hypothetical protein
MNDKGSSWCGEHVYFRKSVVKNVKSLDPAGRNKEESWPKECEGVGLAFGGEAIPSPFIQRLFPPFFFCATTFGLNNTAYCCRVSEDHNSGVP